MVSKDEYHKKIAQGTCAHCTRKAVTKYFKIDNTTRTLRTCKVCQKNKIKDSKKWRLKNPNYHKEWRKNHLEYYKDYHKKE